MEEIFNGFQLDIPDRVFPLSTDSAVLADFVRLPRNATVIDLGAGCGTLGTYLCAKDVHCHVTGIEIDELSHQSAVGNIQRNHLEDRMSSILMDLRDLPSASYHVCVSNPPYFQGGPASRTLPVARRNDFCSTDDLLSAASKSLRFGGYFYLVHKPDHLSELCVVGSRYDLELKHLRLVHHAIGSPISMILLQFRKGGKPGMIMDEISLFHPDGTPTDAYHSIYHDLP